MAVAVIFVDFWQVLEHGAVGKRRIVAHLLETGGNGLEAGFLVALSQADLCWTVDAYANVEVERVQVRRLIPLGSDHDDVVARGEHFLIDSQRQLVVAVKRALHQLVLARLLPAVDEHDGEVARDEPALRALGQIRCHNSISLLLADYAESLRVAVDLLVQCEGEEVLLFVLHAGTGRRDLVVSPLCRVDIDIRARKRLQVIAELHVELATW